MKTGFIWTLVIFLLAYPFVSHAEEHTGFTREDRERLIRLEATLTTFMHQVDKRFEAMDKRFEDMNKRFEAVDKRFEDLTHFLYILSGIFTTLVTAILGLVIWDRRTIIKQAKRESVEYMEKDSSILHALRNFAMTNPDMAKALKELNLL